MNQLQQYCDGKRNVTAQGIIANFLKCLKHELQNFHYKHIVTLLVNPLIIDILQRLHGDLAHWAGVFEIISGSVREQ